MTADKQIASLAVDAARREGAVKAFAQLVRFSHTVFAMPFALMAVFLAERAVPALGQLVLIVLCMVAARSAAMTFNRIADCRIDARNPRTALRPLQKGVISLRQAWVFFVACSLAFVAACSGFWFAYGNPWPLRLSLPVLAFISAYSLTKRFTSLCHLWLGVSLGLSPMAAWLAVRPESFGLSPMLLGFAVLCWVGGFDIIYALQDLDFDRRHGLYSLPARLGPAAALWISRGLHAATIALLAALGMLQHLGAWYWAGLSISAVLLGIEQSMVTARDWSRAGAAFTYANAIMSLVLAACTIAAVLVG